MINKRGNSVLTVIHVAHCDSPRQLLGKKVLPVKHRGKNHDSTLFPFLK